TLEYLDFVLGNVIEVCNEGLIKRFHIPVTITSLADEIASHYSHQPFDEKTITDIYNSIFEGVDVNQYLRPTAYNQVPPKDQDIWRQVLTNVVSGAGCSE